MAVMKRDVNFGMFVLIIATLLVFAGFTAYYQTTFENLTSEYRGKLGELSDVTSNLQQEKIKLNQTSIQLQIKAEKEKSLNEKYEEMVAWKDREEKSKIEFQGLYTESQGFLATAEHDRDAYKAERDTFEEERDTERSLKVQYKGKWDNCEEELDTYTG
ncbi:MAG: hypothetical protein QF632_03605 [Candidatus Woesearchaeota archaeon]|jgi:outer membrane receptor for ferrienterochelin and colicin|nr:hypothetical protein [Candidatus Woesearchaeota archaeon]|tara:strand:- start:657 stop:1133 length:477 start_codon:yes stop_codon:yes gene_type:complete